MENLTIVINKNTLWIMCVWQGKRRKIEEISLQWDVEWKENENFSSTHKGMLLLLMWMNKKKKFNILFWQQRAKSADKKCEIRVKLCIEEDGFKDFREINIYIGMAVSAYLLHWLVWHWLSTRRWSIKLISTPKIAAIFVVIKKRRKKFFLLFSPSAAVFDMKISATHFVHHVWDREKKMAEFAYKSRFYSNF